jgi:hypothetical protein
MKVHRATDGTVDLHMTSEESARLRSALCQAGSRGSVTAHGGAIRVHVHGEAAEAPEPHKPIEVK